MAQGRSIAATASAAGGAIALALAFVGAGSAYLGWLPPLVGYRMFRLGLLLGVVTLLVGIIGLIRTRGSRRAGHTKAVVGTLLGGGLSALLLTALAPGWGLPAINDITTNPQDPPALRAAAATLEQPLPYPGESFAARQQAAYPDLAPIQLALPPNLAFERVRKGLVELGLTLVASNPDAGVVEASDSSTVFHFVDDVVVRVRPLPTGSVVDVRSRSRYGRSDLGVNARRIRALSEALRAPGE